MAEPIRLVLEVQDRGSQRIQLFETRTRRALGRLEAQLRDIGVSSRRAADALEQGFTRVERSINRTSTRMDSFTRLLRRAFPIVSLSGFILALRRATTEAINLSIQFQATQVVFQSITGSAILAADRLEFLRKEADRVGVVFLSTARSARNFFAATEAAGLAAEQADDIFSALIETSRVLGQSNADLRLTFLAVEQMIGRGVVSMEELRRQLGERIPGAFQIAARAMNVTTQELSDLVRQGQVVSTEFLPAFAEELRKVFGRGLPEAVRNFQSALNRATSGIQEFFNVAGQIITQNPQVIQLLESMADAFQAVAERAKEFVPTAASVGAQIVQLAEQIERARDALGTSLTPDALGAPIAVDERALLQIAKMEEELQRLRDLQQELIRTQTQEVPQAIAGSVTTLSVINDQVNKILESVRDVSSLEAFTTLENEIKRIEDALNATVPGINQVLDPKTENILRAALAAARFELAELKAELEGPIEFTFEERQALDQLRGLSDAAESLEDDIREGQKAADDFTKSIEALGERGTAEFQALEDGLEMLGEAWGNLEADIKEGERSAEEFKNKVKKENEELEREFNRFSDRVRDKLSEIFERPEDLFNRDGLLNFFRSLGAELAAEFSKDFISRQLLNIGNFLGLPGLPKPPSSGTTATQQAGQVASTGAGEGGFSQLFQGFLGGGLIGSEAGLTLGGAAGALGLGLGVGSIASPILGQLGLGGRAGGALSGALGGATAGAIIGGPIGLGIGAVVGGGLGALFGGGSRSRRGRAALRTGTGPFEGGRSVITPFGQLGLADELTDQTLRETDEAIVNFVAQADRTIAALITERQRELVAERLEGRTGPTVRIGEELDDEELAEVLVDRMRQILNTIQLDLGIGAIRTDQIFQGGTSQIIQNVTEAIQVMQAIGELGQETENLSAAEQAINAINQEFDALAASAERLGIAFDDEALRAERIEEFTQGFVDGIEQQILAIEDPLQAALNAEQELADERLQSAEALGISLVQVERLNGLRREQIVEQFANSILAEEERLAEQRAAAARQRQESIFDLGQQLRFDLERTQREGLDLELFEAGVRQQARIVELFSLGLPLNNPQFLELGNLIQDLGQAERAQIIQNHEERQRLEDEQLAEAQGAFFQNLGRQIALAGLGPTESALHQLTFTLEDLAVEATELGIKASEAAPLIERFEEAQRAAIEAQAQTQGVGRFFENLGRQISLIGLSPTQTALHQLTFTLADLRAEAEELGIAASEAAPLIERFGEQQRVEILRQQAIARQAFSDDIGIQILEFTHPLQAALRRQELTYQEQLRQAEEFGLDILQIEELNGLRRNAIIEEFLEEGLQSTTDRIKEFLESLQTSPVLANQVRLTAAQDEFARNLALFQSGELEDQSVLVGSAKDLLDIARDFFASSPDFFRIFEDVQSELRDVVELREAEALSELQVQQQQTAQIITLLDEQGDTAQKQQEQLVEITGQIQVTNEEVQRLRNSFNSFLTRVANG